PVDCLQLRSLDDFQPLASTCDEPLSLNVDAASWPSIAPDAPLQQSEVRVQVLLPELDAATAAVMAAAEERALDGGSRLDFV
ncbi:MAG: hypothetical protein HC838_07970, partial [Spirulinaceae cyanobacterium RM2_2_10]|nr:hypothetical protein [Spirulinaceae cyanobacterium RM2_2_10]